MNRLSICLVSAAYYPYPSGVSEHVHHLGVALKELGHDVHVLTTRYAGTWGDAVELLPVTRFGDARLIPLNGSFATLPVGARLSSEVRDFMRSSEFDIVHCHGMFWPEISYWALRYSRSANFVSLLTAGFRISRLGGGTFRRLFRPLLSRIDGLIPISKRARDAFAAYVPGDYRIIPCGVDLERFRRDLEPLPDRDSSRPVILFMGRLDRRKGIKVLLQAMPEVLRAVPNARLIVAGSGPEESAARCLVTKLGLSESVRFVGRVRREDVPRLYCGCKAFCAPSLGGETLGIVLLEAMASGAPTVASDIPGYDETVRHERDALLVPPGNPMALADALVRVLQDTELRCRIVESGLERVREYEWTNIACRTASYYEEVLSRAAVTTRQSTRRRSGRIPWQG